MVDEAMGMIPDVEAALLVIDVDVAMQGGGGKGGLGDPEERSCASSPRRAARSCSAVNKVDTLKAKTAAAAGARAPGHERARCAPSCPCPPRKGPTSTTWSASCGRCCPRGRRSTAPDMLTDRSERFLASELIREQLFLGLRQEIPYAVAVVIEEWQERAGQGRRRHLGARSSSSAKASARSSWATRAAMIRELGTRARGAISDLLQRPAHLKLHIKVHPDWTTSPDALARYGYTAP